MFVGFFIIGFIAGYIIGMTGAFGIAKRNEAKPLRRESKGVWRFKAKRSEPVVYPARLLRKDEPLPDYHESVPNSWREDTKES